MMSNGAKACPQVWSQPGSDEQTWRSSAISSPVGLVIRLAGEAPRAQFFQVFWPTFRRGNAPQASVA